MHHSVIAMNKGQRNWLIILIISAALLFCSYLYLFHAKTGRKYESKQVAARSVVHDERDSLRNKHTLKIRKIRSPGADIPRKGSTGAEIHRPAGPYKPAGAGKKAGAVRGKRSDE